MPNKVVIKNRILDEDLAKKAREKAKQKMLWAFQEERDKKDKKAPEEKPEE
jgi:hypothetical protein